MAGAAPPSHDSVIVVVAGAIGCSTLDNLAKPGVGDSSLTAAGRWQTLAMAQVNRGDAPKMLRHL